MDAYLDAWMTPRDRRLLRPDPANQTSLASGFRGRSGVDLAPPVPTRDARQAGKANPFLPPPAESLAGTNDRAPQAQANQPRPSIGRFGFELPPRAESKATSVPSTTGDPAQSGPPAQWVPPADSDRTYFPQLKRF